MDTEVAKTQLSPLRKLTAQAGRQPSKEWDPRDLCCERKTHREGSHPPWAEMGSLQVMLEFPKIR